MSYNHCTIMGRLGRDPDVRYTPDGKAIASFSLALDRGKTASGQDLDPDWIDCVAFGKVAESVAEHVKKGMQILVDGRLRQERWEDRQTSEKKSKVRVYCNFWRFTEARKNSDSPPVNGETTGASPCSDQSDPEIPTGESPPEEDLPF